MADIKWIKIVTDIFDDEKILLIESLPESDGIIVIWFKLLCLAGKTNNGGVLLMNDRVPFTDEMLSTIFRRPINTVRLALNTFERFGMVEIVEGTITIPNWEKHQQVDTLERIREQTRLRVTAHREKQKAIACNVTVTQRNATDKEEERERDKKKNRDIVPYETICDRFNSICTSLSKVVSITDKRKQKIKARWNELKTVEAFEQLFYMTEQSDFLCGRERDWKCTFDWLVTNDTNCIKVLEGNYTNKPKKSANPFLDMLKGELNDGEGSNADNGGYSVGMVKRLPDAE